MVLFSWWYEIINWNNIFFVSDVVLLLYIKLKECKIVYVKFIFYYSYSGFICINRWICKL